MKYLLDAMVVVILIVTMIVGYYRGFIRYVISMLGTVVSVVLALLIANALAQPVYERYVQTKLTNSVENAVDSIDVNSIIKNELASLGAGDLIDDSDVETILTGEGTISKNLDGVLSQNGADDATAEELSGKFNNWLSSENVSAKINEVTGDNNNSVSAIMQGIDFTREQIDTAIKEIATDKTKGAEYLEENIVQPIVVPVLKVALFCICFIVLALIIKIILFVSGVFTRLPEISVANHFGGLALGCVKGLLYVLLIAFMLCIVVNSTANRLPTFNSGIAESTYVFKYFFNFFYK